MRQSQSKQFRVVRPFVLTHSESGVRFELQQGFVFDSADATSIERLLRAGYVEPVTRNGHGRRFAPYAAYRDASSVPAAQSGGEMRLLG